MSMIAAVMRTVVRTVVRSMVVLRRRDSVVELVVLRVRLLHATAALLIAATRFGRGLACELLQHLIAAELRRARDVAAAPRRHGRRAGRRGGRGVCRHTRQCRLLAGEFSLRAEFRLSAFLGRRHRGERIARRGGRRTRGHGSGRRRHLHGSQRHGRRSRRGGRRLSRGSICIVVGLLPDLLLLPRVGGLGPARAATAVVALKLGADAEICDALVRVGFPAAGGEQVRTNQD